MTHEECHKRFINELCSISHAHSPVQIFSDLVRAMQIALAKPFILNNERAECLEREYMDFTRKYGDGWKHSTDCMEITVEALNLRREDFLGNILEDIGAANERNGQYFTPVDVARLMAEVCIDDLNYNYTPGKPLQISDCAGGAGVTLIEGVEHLIRVRKIPQRDIIVVHGDIDGRACSIAYVQFSLLGYPAIVCHQNALTFQMYEEPMYTAGWFLHGMPMRGINGERYITRKNKGEVAK